jgi:hypothetical protein
VGASAEAGPINLTGRHRVSRSEEVKATPDIQHVVFISYASGDKADADAVVAMLEGSGVPCWIAPRDVEKGAAWPEAIAAAIGRCRLFLLLLSPASDRSDDVLRELALAGNQKMAIFPLRVRQHVPTRTAYYLDAVQWFDAFELPLGSYAAALVKAVQRQLDQKPRWLPDEVTNSKRRMNPPNPPAWMNRAAAVAIVAILLSLMLQLFFYVTGTSILRGAAYWLVLAVCALIAWGVQYLWHSFKRGKEQAS